ncbi:EAL domain, c-di-GMP-specific phosphodiesterase class I (or its enzymatically inactive variant) [Alkalispirochaeta americana]|uniref:EAL domain, c-di-GMP-specific phosphodiesterase class I (Or its enzymatically inactive variant) n=1 Tax=Alkalispirochaeta americana TaxID=159291 RepID=A0A1N6QVH8_9SPIO|nr:phosphodiesterase [Alkalispirochaeta americana]SIQ20589.1 EAL domain, c-di-GMP-specific phosphodiesterase class I (or its enzymatically inactive variant) [Alkalispirochaeta americana]
MMISIPQVFCLLLLLAGYLFLLWRRALCSRQKLYRDTLTGLPSRTAFDRDYLHRRNKAAPEAVIFLSVNNLRRVNELFGYRQGDAMLQKASRHIEGLLPPLAELYRFSGETFVITCPREYHPSLLAQTILEGLGELSPEGTAPFTLLCTAGIARKGQEGLHTVDDLVRGAAAANAESQQIKEPFLFYTKTLKTTALRKVHIARLLCEAVEEESFTLHYQPIHDGDGEIAALEALLRWSPPPLGPVSPAEFIPLAESSGLITPLGDTVIHRVLEEISSLPPAVRPPVHINISPVQMQSSHLLETLDQATQKRGITRSGIVLEITESHLIKELPACNRLLKELRRRGYKIALDDFGTGFSSLQYLQHLPVDTLKIDRSFLQYRQAPERTSRILSALNDLGNHLHLSVIAEGLETEEQFHLLRSIGFRQFQGYFFSRPKPLVDLLPLFSGSPLSRETTPAEH